MSLVTEIINILHDPEKSVQQQKSEIEAIGINSIDKDGDTALIIETRLGNLESIFFLFNNGADPDIENKFGDTALLIAIEEQATYIAYLLSFTADVNYVNQHGDTPMALAKYFGDKMIIDILKYHGAKDTDKICRQEQSLLNLYNSATRLDSKENLAVLQKYPLIKKLYSFSDCHDMYCTTCGGQVNAIRNKMTPKLELEIKEFLTSLSPNEITKLGDWVQVFNNLQNPK